MEAQIEWIKKKKKKKKTKKKKEGMLMEEDKRIIDNSMPHPEQEEPVESDYTIESWMLNESTSHGNRNG